MLHGGRARGNTELLASSSWPRARASGQEILAAADVTSLYLPLVSSEAGYGLTFHKPQKGAGVCSWKLALKWWFPAPVILSVTGTTAETHWSCRGGADPPDHATCPKAVHQLRQVGFRLQSEAARREEGPATASPCHDKSTEHHCSKVSQALFQQGINLTANTSSCWLLHRDYACVYVSYWMGVLMHYGENIKEIGLKAWKNHYCIWPDWKCKCNLFFFFSGN